MTNRSFTRYLVLITSTDSSDCISQDIAAGHLVSTGSYGFVLKVDTDGGLGCTATALSEGLILIASHCLGYKPHMPVKMLIHAGLYGNECALAAPDCFEASGEALLNPEADFAIVRLATPLVSRDSGFPEMIVSQNFTSFEFAGYGVGSYTDQGDQCASNYGEHLISAKDVVEWRSDTAFGAYAKRGTPFVCEGDSGGPAVVRDEGVTRVAGVLTESEDDLDGPCTAVGGLERWLAVGSFFHWFESSSAFSCTRYASPAGTLYAKCE